MHFTSGIEGHSSRGFTGGSGGVIGINALPLRSKFADGVLSGCIYWRWSGKNMKKQENSRSSRRFVKIFWGIVGGSLLLVIAFFVLIACGALGHMPTFKDLENPKSNAATEIYSADGELLGTYFIENRSYVTFEELPQHLVDALVATEDVRYYRHSGIDAQGLVRVLFKTLLLNRDESGGGSTLTQQLAKNLFPRDTVYSSNRVVRGLKLAVSKFKEWITAVKLERNYTKDEILTMYLNTVGFGYNSFGVRRASRTFFNKSVDSLDVCESAVLVGMLKAPTRYSPKRNPELSKERRNTVIGQMVKYKKLTKAEGDSLSALPLEICFQERDHNTGLAPYFREMVRVMLTAKEPRPGLYFTHEQYQEDSLAWATNPLYGWCRKNPRLDGTEYNVYTDGLRIYTNIDANLQRYAEDAMRNHLGRTLQALLDREKRGGLFSRDVPEEARQVVITSGIHRSDRYKRLKAQGATEKEILADFGTPVEMRVFTWKGEVDTLMSPRDSVYYYKRLLRGALMSMEPQTGKVRAYVGGADFKHFKYDMVYKGRRQVGSTIKPFLYTLAMMEGMDPCTKVPNVEQVFETNDTIWTPRGGSPTEQVGKMVSLRWGLANSVNNVSAWLVKQFSPEAVARMIAQMGIHSQIDPQPSIFLGTSDVSLYEMVAAYGAYVAGGMRVDPVLVSRIEDRHGNLLASFSSEPKEVIDPYTAYLMVKLLEGVVQRGTGGRLRWMYNLQGALGGKTGTTQNNSDGWFMCIQPKLVTGCWVGCEDRAVHFDNMAYGQGASSALPIVGLFLQKAYADATTGISSGDKWEVPKGMENVEFNCDDKEVPMSEPSDFF